MVRGEGGDMGVPAVLGGKALSNGLNKGGGATGWVGPNTKWLERLYHFAGYGRRWPVFKTGGGQIGVGDLC